MWVPHQKKKKKKEKNQNIKSLGVRGRQWREVIFSFIFFINFFLRFSSFCPSEFVGINTESALRDEGYA